MCLIVSDRQRNIIEFISSLGDAWKRSFFISNHERSIVDGVWIDPILPKAISHFKNRHIIKEK